MLAKWKFGSGPDGKICPLVSLRSILGEVTSPSKQKGVWLMLVLSRRPNEKIVLPGLNVTVQVLEVKAGRVRIGVEAPPNVKIMRSEVLQALQAALPEYAEASV